MSCNNSEHPKFQGICLRCDAIRSIDPKLRKLAKATKKMFETIEHNQEKRLKMYKDMALFGSSTYRNNLDGTVTHIPFEDYFKLTLVPSDDSGEEEI